MKPKLQTHERPVPAPTILPMVGVAHTPPPGAHSEGEWPDLVRWSDWWIVAAFLAVMAPIVGIVAYGWWTGGMFHG